MRRRIAVVNDSLSSGGQVLDYAQNGGFTFDSRKVALIGGRAHCEACKSDGVIAKAGGPARLGFGGMGEVALDQDIVRCQCAVPPTISASLAGESWCDDEIERLGPVSDTESGSAVAAVAGVALSASLGQRSGEQSMQQSSSSTPLGDAQPFTYQPDSPSGDDAVQLAGSEGTPGNNQAQNRQFRSVVKTLGLNKDQAQELHQEISGQGLGYHEIMQRAMDMFGGAND